MTFPQIISYKQAVQIPDSFGSWTHLRTVLDSNRQPVFAAGGPAVFFKMQDANDSQKFYALKLFLKEQPNRERNFKAIDSYIRSLRDNPYLANYQYNPSEIWADDGKFIRLIFCAGFCFSSSSLDFFISRKEHLDVKRKKTIETTELSIFVISYTLI